MTSHKSARDVRLEAQVNVVLSWMLRIGVLLCAAVIGLGWVGTLIKPGAAPAAAQAFSLSALTGGGMVPEGAVTHSLPDVAAGLASGSARAVIVAGLMLLIALPLARVALTAVTFAIERDWLYVVLALAVLTLLISGLILGRAL
jgi:uncharacterized membrane protein